MYWRIIYAIGIIIFILFISINIDKQTLNEDKYITVEIKGEIENPGIYNLKLGSTLNDLFTIANLKENADTSQYSLQNVLYNSQVIVVNKKRNDLISINTATLNELITLPGIGESIANRIIEYRLVYGSFNNLEDLMNVNGIGNGKFKKLKEYICL